RHPRVTSLQTDTYIKRERGKKMNIIYRPLVLAALTGYSITTMAYAQTGYRETDLVVNKQVNGVPTLLDSNGITHIARFSDANLVNPWGLTASEHGPFWVADAGAGVSTVYNTVGAPQNLVVSIPASQFNNDPFDRGGIPTGAVFNIAQTLSDQPGGFKISGNETFGVHAPTTASALFLFCTKQGAIVGWNPTVDPAAGGFDPALSGKFGIVVPNASSIGAAAYTGLAMATDANHITHLYAANFKGGTVDVFDGDFNKVSSGTTFADPTLPPGYSPFNVAVITINGSPRIFVTYAIPSDPFGQGRGIVNSFDLDGSNPKRFAQRGQLNAPWGIVLTPSGFGELG